MTFVQHEFSASDLLSLDPATRRLRSQSANAIFAARVLCVPLAGLTSCHVGMLGLGPEEESALAARESLYAGSDGGEAATAVALPTGPLAVFWHQVYLLSTSHVSTDGYSVFETIPSVSNISGSSGWGILLTWLLVRTFDVLVLVS